MIFTCYNAEVAKDSRWRKAVSPAEVRKFIL